MNLGSRFRISLKNLIICIHLLLDSREDKGEIEWRRESQMRQEREKNLKKNQIESYSNHVYLHGYCNRTVL